METTDHKAKRLIRYYERMVGSRDPVKIAEYTNIRIAILPLGAIAGNYKLIKRKRWIFVNDNIPMDSPMFKVVVAHELGHALYCSQLGLNGKRIGLQHISLSRMTCYRIIPDVRRASSVIAPGIL